MTRRSVRPSTAAAAQDRRHRRPPWSRRRRRRRRHRHRRHHHRRLRGCRTTLRIHPDRRLRRHRHPHRCRRPHRRLQRRRPPALALQRSQASSVDSLPWSPASSSAQGGAIGTCLMETYCRTPTARPPGCFLTPLRLGRAAVSQPREIRCWSQAPSRKTCNRHRRSWIGRPSAQPSALVMWQAWADTLRKSPTFCVVRVAYHIVPFCWFALFACVCTYCLHISVRVCDYHQTTQERK